MILHIGNATRSISNDKVKVFTVLILEPSLRSYKKEQRIGLLEIDSSPDFYPVL